MAVKNIKSRKKDAYSQESFEKNLAAKQSLVDKVNNKPNNNKPKIICDTPVVDITRNLYFSIWLCLSRAAAESQAYLYPFLKV